MSISDQFVVRNLDTGEVFRPPFNINSIDAPVKLPPASPDDVIEFKKQFSTFPYDEKLLHVVSCMLWESLSSFHARKIKKRHAGTIFISNRHLSFAEESSGIKKSVKIGIPLSEIIDLAAEDYGLSEGIVVSTMRDTKFFFEQFPARGDAFDALYRTWTLSQNSSADQLASIFDPLGGISAVSSNAVRNMVSPPTDSASPSYGSAKAVPQSPMSPQSPRPSPAVKASAQQQPSSSASVAPKLSHPPPPAPATTLRQTNQWQQRGSGPNDEHHYMDVKSGDSWFMTLTKIYYWLGAQTRQPSVRRASARMQT